MVIGFSSKRKKRIKEKLMSQEAKKTPEQKEKELLSTIETLSGQLAELEQKSNAIINERDQMQNECAKLEAMMNGLKSGYDDLIGQIRTQGKELADLRNKVIMQKIEIKRLSDAANKEEDVVEWCGTGEQPDLSVVQNEESPIPVS